MKLPRIMFAAQGSGSGKTLITCGILQALIDRGLNPVSFKCGPDYIDPMFHQRVIGNTSKNLDPFFTGEEMTKYLFADGAQKGDISVLEGVMGYYDGIAGISTRASSYHLAGITDTPVILIVNTKGMSLSALPVIKGFLEYRSDSRIKGILLNQMSEHMYPQMKEKIEKELHVKVLGYVPKVEHFTIESRHLGLVTPNEITMLKEKLKQLAAILEKTLQLDEMIEIAQGAKLLEWTEPKIEKVIPDHQTITIGIAKDDAFCFIYRDNLELLQKMGAKLKFFSPLTDYEIPKDLDGLIFYGGYPELHAEKLSKNTAMLKSIQNADRQGMPYLAECGGFMYLHSVMEDLNGQEYQMADLIKGRAYYTGKLKRFGYVTLTAKQDQVLCSAGEQINAHEFHYYDSTSNGDGFTAEKPLSGRKWECMHGSDCFAAGFPHLYYYGNPEFAGNFLKACAGWQKEGKNNDSGNNR